MGNHVALRLTKAEMLDEGTFSPLFKNRYVIVNVEGAGVTADIRSLATGHITTVNPRRLKFVEAIPQHALHLKGLPRATFRWLLCCLATPGRTQMRTDMPACAHMRLVASA